VDTGGPEGLLYRALRTPLDACGHALEISGSEGWGFESLRACHAKPLLRRRFRRAESAATFRWPTLWGPYSSPATFEELEALSCERYVLLRHDAITARDCRIECAGGCAGSLTGMSDMRGLGRRDALTSGWVPVERGAGDKASSGV
jgi:hypothetical protein